MDSLQDNADWDLDFYSRIMEEAVSTDFYLNDSPRERDEPSVRQGSKACREKIRRDRMNQRFSELSNLLEPGRPAKTDKSAILSDAIRTLNQLKAEAKELKEANMKLEEDIKFLKEEKHELREEKSLMKAEKEGMEECVKAMSMLPAGYVPQHPAAYHPNVNKMIAFPMWHWVPPAARDISKDHELRPPMA